MSDAATAVRWLLQQSEPEARRVAVLQIAKVSGGETAELLLRALGDDDWRVRKEAAAISPSIDRRDEIVAALVTALEETVNIGLRNAAVEALVAIGPDAISATVGALPRLDADARKLAIEVLGGLADLRCTEALSRALDDEDVNVQVAAAEALGNARLAGEEARDLATRSLVKSLSNRGAILKIAALESLARLEARLPWSIFRPHVTDPLLRRYAIAAACGSAEPDAVRALALATGDPSPTIAREAIVALGELVASGPQEASLLGVARAALGQTPVGRVNVRRAARNPDDAPARSSALALLGLIGDPSDIALLVDALGEEAAERADLALRIFGSDAIVPLLAAARSASPSVRAAALELAASLDSGPDGSGIHDALRAAVGDPSPEVVVSALESLGSLGNADDLVRISLMVGHSEQRIAAAATNAVWGLASRHVETARALLNDSGAGSDPLALGCILIGAIASTRELLEDDVHLLERALAHDRPQVRRAAIEALAQAGGEAAAEAVVFALADEDHEVQLAAVRALGRLGRAEPLIGVARIPALTGGALRALGDVDPARAVEAASPLVKHPDVAIACAAVEAMGRLGDAGLPENVSGACEDGLFSALDHPDPEVVKLALSIVGARPGPRALARLGHCLDHSASDVRRVAAELLGHQTGLAAQALLRARYERERDPIVRAAIAAAASLRSASQSDGSGGPSSSRRPRDRE
ncbi:MAG: HEAT repeat domain-containing protein [Polyangiaceae bacterium]